MAHSAAAQRRLLPRKMTSRQEELSRLVTAAKAKPFWLDQPDAPEAREPVHGDRACDLAVIGGGFTGLWTALLAKEANPGRSVLVLEGNRVGWAASGRNGGFCDASLTHGAANGRERFPAEFTTLQRLGMENLNAIETALGRHGIDCGFERTGTIEVATSDHQVDELRETAETDGGAFLDAGTMRAHLPGGPVG
jgi:glycine/D-amino acid oxidase-like deaminating enzyme